MVFMPEDSKDGKPITDLDTSHRGVTVEVGLDRERLCKVLTRGGSDVGSCRGYTEPYRICQ